VIYLIDASVYVFRAYHSMLPDMTDRDGNASHAVFGFAKFLSDLVEYQRPEYIAVAFDQSLTSCFRSKIYPAYKKNREPPPVDLALQFERCVEFCKHLGVPSFGSHDYEADDVIGSLVHRARRVGLKATVVSRDKDLAQLIREGDIYWDYTSRERFGYLDIEKRFGVAPERFADYLALMGDAVDNIPGVPGIGAKTAAVLMREFASLDELYEGLSRVALLKCRGASSLAAKLIAHREAAYLARQLTVIACDVPLEIESEHLRRRLPDVPALTAFYDHHRFGPMLRNQTARITQLPLD
jgi:5'-3' exonuclease